MSLPDRAKHNGRVVIVTLKEFPGHFFPEGKNYARCLCEAGRRVTVIAPRYPGQLDKETAGGIEIIRPLKAGRLRFKLLFPLAAFIIRKLNPESVIVFWEPGAAVVSWLLPGGKTVKLCDFRTGAINDGIKGRVIDGLIRFEARFFDGVMTIDRALGDKLFGAAFKRPVFYLPMGLDYGACQAALQPAERERLRAGLGFSPGQVIGIYVGTSYRRELEKFFAAVALANRTAPDLRVLVVGDAASDAALMGRETVRRLVASGIVTLAGGRPFAELVKYLKAADFGICFVPQRPYFDKQTSTKIKEYSACALPVVTTATAANRQLVGHGAAGLVAEDDPESFAAALTEMVGRLGFFRAGAAAGRTSFASYDWAELVRRHLLPALAQFSREEG